MHWATNVFENSSNRQWITSGCRVDAYWCFKFKKNQALMCQWRKPNSGKQWHYNSYHWYSTQSHHSSNRLIKFEEEGIAYSPDATLIERNDPEQKSLFLRARHIYGPNWNTSGSMKILLSQLHSYTSISSSCLNISKLSFIITLHGNLHHWLGFTHRGLFQLNGILGFLLMYDWCHFMISAMLYMIARPSGPLSLRLCWKKDGAKHISNMH